MNNFRNHISRSLDHDPIADSNIFAINLALVVKGCSANDCALSETDRRNDGDWSESTLYPPP